MKNPLVNTILRVLGFSISLTGLSYLRLFIVYSLFIVCFYPARAQIIENVKASFTGGKVTVSYDIVQADPAQEFELTLFSSHNNFSTSLKLVHGDIGKIKPGTGKKIEWDAMAELGTFKGEITFRVKGEPIIPVLALKNPVEGTGVKRGKALAIKWSGGAPGQNVKLELYKGTSRISVIGDTKNTGEYTWTVPKDFQKGKDYTVKATVGRQHVESGKFSVRSRFPLALKAAPIIVIGVIIALWPDDEPKDLPGPPDPE